MKENELRIGNLLKRGGVLVTVDTTTIFGFSASAYQYESIPITPEWLERFGFKEYSPGLYWIKIHESQERYLETVLSFKEFWDFTIIIKHTWTPEHTELWIRAIRSVHELQNLYFALCGKELQLTSEKQAAD